MTLFRATAGVVIAVACLAAIPLLALSSLVVGSAAQGLLTLGAIAYVIALAWMIFAPVVLLIAAATVGRTPWPWVVACVVQMMVVVALGARFDQWFGGAYRLLLVVVVAGGVASIAAALRLRELPEGSVGSSATASPSDVPPSEGD